MAGRRAGAGLALAALALSAAACGGTKTLTTTVTRTVTRTVTTTRTVTRSSFTPACFGPLLSGTFALVPGSGHAGHVAYALTLTNTSGTTCTLRLERLELQDRSGRLLPTNPSGSLPRNDLAPSASTTTNVEISPDVPGTGDNQSGACQPKAYMLEIVTPGGGKLLVPIKPPTSVCGQGSLVFAS